MRTSRNAVVLAAGLVAGIVLGAGGMALLSTSSSDDQATKKSTSTAAVERRTLEVVETVSGNLAAAQERTVPTIGAGTITTAATVGASLERGSVLAKVDDQPVVVIFGDTPVWRAFTSGMSDGPDVKELEGNLVALGYRTSGLEIDNSYDSSTSAAVKKWETDLGIDSPDGTIPAGQVVVVPGPAQVTEATAAGTRVTAGDSLASVRPVGGEGLQLTFSVSEEADRYQPGKPVTIVTSDGAKHPATIASIARAASSSSGGGFGGGGQQAASFTVTATPDSPDGLAAGPVTVEVPTERAANVLAVPSRALVAVVEGGQAVELADTHQLVKVEVGVFADGWTQVAGNGIKVGTKVVVPS